jgi:alkyl sulfatase BDS1-like metallo-beta-lactamase superfamily hydrolase
MNMQRKDATRFTEAANAALLQQLDWEDMKAFADASRGFIASLDAPVITDPGGRPVWDLDAYPFLAEEKAPPSVNPSLWRQSRLNALSTTASSR